MTRRLYDRPFGYCPAVTILRRPDRPVIERPAPVPEPDDDDEGAERVEVSAPADEGEAQEEER